MASQLIDNIETNDMNFKHLETTKDIVISPKNEFGDPQRPDATHRWSAKVSDGTNYVGDYAVKIDGASLIVDSKDFTKLQIGSYQLEVWEEWIDPDGTQQRSIYPSPRQTIPFTIYANIPDQAEKEIKQIGFQDVVDQAVMNVWNNYVIKVNTIDPDQTATVVQSAADGKNYVTFNIPQGKTGEQGFRGPAGKNFHIQQTFTSVKDMEASQGKGFEDGDFALIASDVNDPDNSKFYVWSEANKQFTYMDDLSGSTGIQGPVGPAPTLHVTKVTTVPNGGQPSFTATPVGNGNYNIEIGLPKGDKGDTGSRGYSFWAMKMTAGGNVSGRYITDLYNASATNLPEVNDLVVQPDGNVYQVTGVSNTDDGSNGGGTFNLGSALFSINDQAEYQALNNKFNNMQIGTRNLLHHSDTFDGWDIGNSVTITSDKYLNGIIAVLGNTGLDSSQVISNLDGPYDNQPVTWTVYAKADNVGDKLHAELFGSGGATDQPLTNNWQIYQFTGQRNMNGSSFYLWGCQGNKGNIYVALPFAVVGNMIGTWEPNPEDTITVIQALQQRVSQLEQKINQSAQPASSATQPTQPAASSATR